MNDFSILYVFFTSHCVYKNSNLKINVYASDALSVEVNGFRHIP